jgi:peptide/nickel transport system permease protein
MLKQVAFLFSSLLILFALLAPLFLSKLQVNSINILQRYSPPSLEHFFGVDEVGRDLFYRFVFGGQHTVLIALGTAILSTGLGSVVARIAYRSPVGLRKIPILIPRLVFLVPKLIFLPRDEQWWASAATRIIVIPYLAVLTWALFLIAVASGAIAVFGVGATSNMVLVGTLLSTGVVYVFYHRTSRYALYRAIALTLLWATALHSTLDLMGLGVLAPNPSWGTMLSGQSPLMAPRMAAAAGLLMLAICAFGVANRLSKRGRTAS